MNVERHPSVSDKGMNIINRKLNSKIISTLFFKSTVFRAVKESTVFSDVQNKIITVKRNLKFIIKQVLKKDIAFHQNVANCQNTLVRCV